MGAGLALSLGLGPSPSPESRPGTTQVWSGFKKECCSDADNFQVVFPAQADTLDRANLLGATVLLDFAFFETQNQV